MAVERHRRNHSRKRKTMTDLEAPITEVIVYADRALVTRRGGIHLAAGEHELRINNLPQLLRESVRASGQGPQGTRILNVDITTAVHLRPICSLSRQSLNYYSASMNCLVLARTHFASDRNG